MGVEVGVDAIVGVGGTGVSVGTEVAVGGGGVGVGSARGPSQPARTIESVTRLRIKNENDRGVRDRRNSMISGNLSIKMNSGAGPFYQKPVWVANADMVKTTEPLRTLSGVYT
jgi:hypothetical protein